MRNKLGLKILDRYIIKKFLGTFFFSIALIILVVVVFDSVEKIDDFIEMKAPLKAILLDYYINFVPYFINLFCGLFTFIAVIFITSKMAAQTELIAILSSGVSFKRLIWPYFLSAMVITALSLYLNLEVIPVANQRRVEFESKYFKKNRYIQYEPHIFRQIYPGTFAYIRNFTNQNKNAGYLSIERYDGSSIVETLEAANVTYDTITGSWTADKYITRSFDKAGKETYAVHDNLDTLINLNITELGKVEDLVTTMKFGELNEFLAQQKEKGSDMVPFFLVERQKRFSYPISTFILTIIGVSLSSRKSRGGTGLSIGIGLGLCFGYILLGRVGEEIAKSSPFLPEIMVWLPNIVFTLIAIYVYNKAPK